MRQATAEADAILLGSAFSDRQLAQVMRQELIERLAESHRSERPLRVYAGYDASRPNLHLGHTITMRKLRVFQGLGHDVVFLIGTLTAQIGDPSDRLYDRPRIPMEQVANATATFAAQMSLILDPERTTVLQNGDWLDHLTLPEILGLASAFTVQQITSPAAIKDRLKSNKPVGLHELLYPLMQGYDALHLGADIQLGTVGPIFNILAGRHLQKLKGQRPCVGITYPALWGTRGHRRMSKREGTHIALTEEPDEQFAKVMSIDDETMRQWVNLIPSWPPDQIQARLRDWDTGVLHPMKLKEDLAFDIVQAFHSREAALEAKAHFERKHRRHESSPDSAVPVPAEPGCLLDVLMTVDAVASKGHARRLLRDGAIRVNGTRVLREDHQISAGDVVAVGRRHLYVLRPEGTHR